MPNKSCKCGEGQAEGSGVRSWAAAFLRDDTDIAWQDQAACNGMYPNRSGQRDLFFPERGHSWVANAAKEICLGCPVRVECKYYRDQTGSKYGIWGGEVTPR